MSTQTTIKELHEKAVQQLIDAHSKRTDQPLILAIRFNLEDEDIHLLEVLKDFPGDDEDELLVTEFGPSANLIILGKLHLVLGSPAQVRSAIKRNDKIIADAKEGKVVFSDNSSESKKLEEEIKQ